MEDILDKLCSFKKTEFFYIPRKINGVAPRVAKFGFEKDIFFFFFLSGLNLFADWFKGFVLLEGLACAFGFFCFLVYSWCASFLWNKIISF